MAFRRLHSLLSTLRQEPAKLSLYNSIIQDQIRNDFIEQIDSSKVTGNIVHYIPHHCVTKDSATTPIRIVYDCSAKEKNKLSLNDCLLKGPPLVNDMLSILLRFRLFPYACSSDVEKAFLQVNLKDCDRDAVRFLWPSDPSDPNSKILTYRFKVVLFGSTASQFLLNSTILHHLSKYECGISDLLKEATYIDNVVYSFKTERDMLNFYYTSKEILTNGSFN